MAYFPPFIDASGLNIPTFLDIENYLVSQAQNTFGADIYLGNDSQDFQQIALIAQLQYDTLLAAQLAFNSQSPRTAIGVGLDGVVSINGVGRMASSNSIATVTLTGTPFTAITSGIVSDLGGNKWNLPSSVVIGSGGTVSVTATAQASGAIGALSNQITSIQTPTFGWASVTNPAAALPGQSAEADSALRNRQALSVANPSQALTTGILGGIFAVPTVTRAALYENDTGAALGTLNGVPNPGNYPAHSITAVILGGDGQTIANAIDARKTPGCYTDGDQVFTVNDIYGTATTIRFYRPINKTIVTVINIKALTGYTTTIGTNALTALVNYINSLDIGQPVIVSELWQYFLDVSTSKRPPFSLTSLTTAISGNAQGTADLTMNFNWLPVTTTGNITLTVT